MMSPKTSDFSKPALALSAGFAVIALLLSGADRWDGVYFSYLAATNGLAGLERMLTEASYPVLLLAMRGLFAVLSIAQVEFWPVAKAIMLLGWFGLAWEANRLARGVFKLDESAARWVSALVFMFPGFVLLHASVHIVVVFIWVAMAGHRLWRGEGLGKRLAGLVLMGIGFQVNANLVFVLGLEVVCLWLSGVAIKQALLRFAGLFAFSVLGYATFRYGFAPTGFHAEAGYNNFVSPLHAAGAKRWLVGTAMWATWLVLIAGSTVLALFVLRQSKATVPSLLHPRKQILASLFLCGSAFFAYLAVGKFAPLIFPVFLGTGSSVYAQFMQEFAPAPFHSGLNFQNVRHSMVLGAVLPIATVVFALASAQQRGLSRAATQWLLALAWLHSALWAVPAHHHKWVQGALDESIVQALGGQVAPPVGAGVLIQRDQEQFDWYDGVESNYLLYRAYGQAAWSSGFVYASSGPSAGVVEQRVIDGLGFLAQHQSSSGLMQWFVATDFKAGAQCSYKIQLKPHQPNWLDLVWRMPFAPQSIPAARVLAQQSNCG